MHQPLMWEEDWEKVTPREPFKPAPQGSSLYVGLPPLAVRLAADAAKAAAAQSPSNAPQSTSTDLTTSTGRKRPNASTAKSLRPQQVMMIELQKKLDVLMKEYSVVETENSRLRARLRVIEAVLPVRQKMQKQLSQPLPNGIIITGGATTPGGGGGTSMAGTPPQPQPPQGAADAAERSTGSGHQQYCFSGGGDAAGASGGGAIIIPPLMAAQCQQQQLQHQASLQHALPPQASHQLPSHLQPQQHATASGGGGAVSSSTTTTTTTTSATAAAAAAPQQQQQLQLQYRHHNHNHNQQTGGGLLLRHALDSPTTASSPQRSSAEPDLDSGCSPLLHPSAASTLDQWLRPRHASSSKHPHPHLQQQQQQQQQPAGRSPDEERWLEIWKAWVREASLLVQVYDARPNELYVKRLDDAFSKLRQAEHDLDLAHPELICNMRQVNMETGVEEVPPDSFWTLVAAGMRLTPAQVADCRTALTLYRERMEVVMAERRSLADQLASCMGALHLAEAEGRAAPGSMQRERLTLEAEEVAAALHANVEAEGHTTGLARDLLRSDLFTAIQCARGSMLSYPYYPDALAMIAAVVANADAAAAQQQQQQQQGTAGDGSGSGSGSGNKAGEG
ncbi:hypothetical protein HYH02_008818 [Chlamydomonas schloesseri]|uniref:Uncharacterized protein n=1 Tax=Chlamydomonas schloesseri TaxID=2026947 RepID=A0A835WDF7_9CHLO|nr:hypothetical protein HYH02_008818 [Chlamydomonas schloesseri]|eukprot:KAG2445353.1 hypothetical protein HYH02_008818 [Chlamydomonas schloesseri]